MNYSMIKTAEIILIEEKLGKLCGYYQKIEGCRFIHINENLPTQIKTDVLSCLTNAANNNENEPFFLFPNAEQKELFNMCS